MSDANVNITTSIEDGDIVSYRDIPYAVLDDDISGTLREDFFHELGKIKKFYQIYKQGMDFTTDGSNGDYIPSQLRFKKAAGLINKEARFMFSQAPDINIQGTTVEDAEKEQIEQLQILVDNVLERNHFQKLLLQSAKDCFIGKRIACLVDFSEESGVLLNNSIMKKNTALKRLYVL